MITQTNDYIKWLSLHFKVIIHLSSNQKYYFQESYEDPKFEQRD